ncbi:DUF488 domain-containing protein [Pseudorhodoferax sp.]|uniref:DUF488 domain-containing protein n=1 Tax=Pseudorhodoferax sp. TaxID=1993553 RepID=UPI002DD61B36|nr:DUF488 domain-containing protein [Pseudorhodoferax sp.]
MGRWAARSFSLTRKVFIQLRRPEPARIIHRQREPGGHRVDGDVAIDSRAFLLDMMKTSFHLYTFGYEGLDLESFIARLHRAGVRTVVDVRELPLSRKRGFSKTSFSAALAESGIAYLHAPTLGCPKTVRDQYKRDGSWARYTSGFMRHVASQEAAVAELAKLAKATPTCLVCFEADFNYCHRTFVARAAHAAGAPSVIHLDARTACSDSGLRAAA